MHAFSNGGELLAALDASLELDAVTGAIGTYSQGIATVEAQLTAAWDDGRPDTPTAFQRVGKAYLAFARENPAYYSAMFESGVPLEGNPGLLLAGERAFAVIRAASERLVAMAPLAVV